MTSSPPRVLPKVLAERYEVLEILGRGAMGAVVLAHDRRLDRQVAVKVLLRLSDPVLRRRFEREAAVLARIQHPAVVRFLDHGVAEGEMYLVMEALEGSSLAAAAGTGDAVARMLPVADALDVVHAQGLLHRDVKLENIVETTDGRVVLIDFGLYRDPDLSSLTGKGALVGTLGYLAPELLQGHPASPASDWYAWGICVHRLVTGGYPYTISEVLRWASAPGISPPRLGSSTRWGPLLPLVAACLSAEPADRPTCAADVRALIEEGSRRGAIPARPGAAGAAPRPPRTGALPPSLALAGTILLAASVIWLGGTSPPGPADQGPPPATARPGDTATRDPDPLPGLTRLREGHTLPDGSPALAPPSLDHGLPPDLVTSTRDLLDALEARWRRDRRDFPARPGADPTGSELEAIELLAHLRADLEIRVSASSNDDDQKWIALADLRALLAGTDLHLARFESRAATLPDEVLAGTLYLGAGGSRRALVAPARELRARMTRGLDARATHLAHLALAAALGERLAEEPPACAAVTEDLGALLRGVASRGAAGVPVRSWGFLALPALLPKLEARCAAPDTGALLDALSDALRAMDGWISPLSPEQGARLEAARRALLPRARAGSHRAFLQAFWWWIRHGLVAGEEDDDLRAALAWASADEPLDLEARLAALASQPGDPIEAWVATGRALLRDLAGNRFEGNSERLVRVLDALERSLAGLPELPAGDRRALEEVLRSLLVRVDTPLAPLSSDRALVALCLARAVHYPSHERLGRRTRRLGRHEDPLLGAAFVRLREARARAEERFTSLAALDRERAAGRARHVQEAVQDEGLSFVEDLFDVAIPERLSSVIECGLHAPLAECTDSPARIRRELEDLGAGDIPPALASPHAAACTRLRPAAARRPAPRDPEVAAWLTGYLALCGPDG